MIEVWGQCSNGEAALLQRFAVALMLIQHTLEVWYTQLNSGKPICKITSRNTNDRAVEQVSSLLDDGFTDAQTAFALILCLTMSSIPPSHPQVSRNGYGQQA